ncbi:MAG: alpha/beta hydrolase, partial [Leptospiraceae bacterium]|nr:alpha/beta hydrolase [Leptospiraceae bacterium]
MNGKIYFAHGKESGPMGSKIQAMMEVGKSLGFECESPSYEGMDNPDDRVKKLIKLKPEGNPLILIGSSMGSYISTIASKEIKPDGLFLLAPAFYIPEYPEQTPIPVAKKT